MASPKFDANIVRASRRLQDARATASESDTGHRFTAAILADYEMQAIFALVREMFSKVGVQFGQVMPELVKPSAALTLTAGAVAFPTDAWLFLTLRSATGFSFTKLTDQSDIDRVLAGQDPFIVPSTSRPYFYEENGSLKTLGVTVGDVYGRYVILHPTRTANDSVGDLLLSSMWDDEIVNRMVQYGLADLKGALAVTQG